MGKTFRALAELERPLLISASCMETLRDICHSGPHATTHLVFDEFDYRRAGKGGKVMTVNECLVLLQSELPATIQARYSPITVPPIPRIFTTNRTLAHPQHDHIFPPPETTQQADALARRYRVIHITQAMWGGGH